jgi:hypothetical protein
MAFAEEVADMAAAVMDELDSVEATLFPAAGSQTTISVILTRGMEAVGQIAVPADGASSLTSEYGEIDHRRGDRLRIGSTDYQIAAATDVGNGFTELTLER